MGDPFGRRIGPAPHEELNPAALASASKIVTLCASRKAHGEGVLTSS